MSEFPVAGLVESPAASDFLVMRHTPRIILGKCVTHRFQFVDLPSGARLVAVQTTRVDKEWT